MPIFPNVSSVFPTQLQRKLTPICGMHEEKKTDDQKCSMNMEEDSLIGNEIIKNKKVIKGYTGYGKRNVYKSILRHMSKHIKNSNISLQNLLNSLGYTQQDIEHAFCKINYANSVEKGTEIYKKARCILDKILEKKSIYGFILKDSLEEMINNIQEKKLGKITAKNAKIYIEVCKAYYKALISILSS